LRWLAHYRPHIPCSTLHSLCVPTLSPGSPRADNAHRYIKALFIFLRRGLKQTSREQKALEMATTLVQALDAVGYFQRGILDGLWFRPGEGFGRCVEVTPAQRSRG
jgi:hypothetical protein